MSYDPSTDTLPGCPDDPICQHCPCAAGDDVCFPGERLRAERDTLREALERARTDIVEIIAAGFDSTRRRLAARACGRVSEALAGPRGRGACEHDWIDMRNEVIESGEMCSHCGALRAAPWQEGR